MDPVVGWMARWYQKQVGTELRKYGLRYEDLLDPGMNLVSYEQYPGSVAVMHSQLRDTTAIMKEDLVLIQIF